MDYTIEKDNKYIYVIPKNEINKGTYETKIMQENSNDLADITLKLVDITDRFYKYQINGKPFKEWIKGHKLNKKDIVFIIKGIEYMLNKAGNYLISENSILLDLDSITITGKNKFYFTIVPNMLSDFSFELSKFLIKMLRYVDSEDKGAINLAYKLFVKSSKDYYTIDDLLKIVEEGEYE